MSAASEYCYILEIRDVELKRVLLEKPLESVSKLVEHFRFEARCRGLVDDEVESLHACVTPLWPSERNGPHVLGLQVMLEPGGQCEPVVKKYGILPFASQSQSAAQGLLAQGVLKANERFYYLVSAFPITPTTSAATESRVPGKRKFQTSVRRPQLEFVQKRAPACPGATAKDLGEALFDVYVPRHVIDDILRQVKKSGEREQAGFLIGYLGRDPATHRPYCVVTAQAQATEGVESTCTSFRFSERTFLAAHRLLELRGQAQERIVGWQHSHTWCAQCGKRDQCTVSTVFWSPDDQMVHESAFPQPYQLGLVVGLDPKRSADPYSLKMYGWQDATIFERPFRVFDPGGHDA